MRSIKYIAIAGIVTLVLQSCSNHRNPGRVYMPDMAYSRAYESYAPLDSSVFTTNPLDKGGKIFFNATPVNGTLRRGDAFPYTLPNNADGYAASGSVKNPFDTIKISPAEMAEIGRLYDINCGICHGDKGVADGPLAGKIGAVANLSLPVYKAMKDGTMFHSITYGRNNMGSYAAQLTREQRWKIIKYVRQIQGVDEKIPMDSAAVASTTAPVADTTAATN